ncbi:MAG: FAD-binding oxidoreductase [Actinobacteria bacterium]|nr:FAD-binding oxidoreductase [Actinomycetota bacterium]
MIEFEFVVVGNGMFGSAAARYLSQQSDAVAVIGPGEPDDELTHDGVYASHYDERRLVRLLGRSKLRSEIGRMAMANYRWLEERSGIQFYDPVGYLIVNSDDVEDNNLESPMEVMAALDIAHTLFTAGDPSWRTIFPDFDFPETHWVIHEPDPAGVIDPRAMLRAQNVVAARDGAVFIPEIVVNLQDDGNGVQIETQSGDRYRAGKVLVTVGSFTNCFSLFPNPLPLHTETEVIILGQVTPQEAARLSAMPALAYTVDDAVLRDIYMAPPARYADGNFYIKMGANTPSDFGPSSLREIQDWFRCGASDVHLADFERVLTSILPAVEFLSFRMKRCILTRTPDKYPIIDQVTSRCYVASGAHGSGAKSADAIGMIAAGLVLDGRWPTNISRQYFRASK